MINNRTNLYNNTYIGLTFSVYRVDSEVHAYVFTYRKFSFKKLSKELKSTEI